MTDVTGSAGPRQDYDLFSEDYVRDPATYWARFRSECPVVGPLRRVAHAGALRGHRLGRT